MKGRKGMELRGTKIALAAVLTCLLSLTAWLGVSQLTARADSQNIATASANAVYNVVDDSITVCDGEGTYPFFTVANASKKVPAANQWVTTDNGTVYLSGKTGASVYYFAKSTNPKPGEIVAVEVPAVPTIAKVTYTPTATTKNDIFKVLVKYSYFDTAKWKGVSKKTSAVVSNKLINCRGEWWSLDDLVNNTDPEEGMTLDQIQKFGGVLNLSVASARYYLYDDDETTYTKKTTATVKQFDAKYKAVGTLLAFNTDDALYPLRAGAVKQLKINKASVGPSVSIDYANHGIKLKRGYAYFKMDGDEVSAVDEPDASAEATITPLSAAKTVYRDSTNESEYYVVCKTKNNKKSSTYTHVELTKETTMADASADAIVSGVYGNDSYLKITMPSDNAKTAYQYAIAKENYLETASGNAGTVEKFNYKKSVDDKLKWKSATINASKGSVIVKLAKKTLAGADANYLYVRKAAVAKNGEFSSQVIRFTIPNENAPKWVKHVQNATSDVEMPAATVKYIANGVFGVDLVAGEISIGTDNKPNGKVTIGKNSSYDLKALADVQAKLNTASADASADAYFVAEDLKQKTNLAVSVTIKEGALKSGTVANTDFVAATTANTLKPSIKSVTESNGSVKFTFNTTIKGGNDNAASTVVGTVTVASGNAQKNITDFTVNTGTNDITISGLAKDDTVTLSSILFGNKYGKNYVDLSGSNKKSGKAKG